MTTAFDRADFQRDYTDLQLYWLSFAEKARAIIKNVPDGVSDVDKFMDFVNNSSQNLYAIATDEKLSQRHVHELGKQADQKFHARWAAFEEMGQAVDLACGPLRMAEGQVLQQSLKGIEVATECVLASAAGKSIRPAQQVRWLYGQIQREVDQLNIGEGEGMRGLEHAREHARGVTEAFGLITHHYGNLLANYDIVMRRPDSARFGEMMKAKLQEARGVCVTFQGRLKELYEEGALQKGEYKHCAHLAQRLEAATEAMETYRGKGRIPG